MINYERKFTKKQPKHKKHSLIKWNYMKQLGEKN